MKKILSIITFASLLLTIGCSKDWLDINSDPNNPETVTSETLLPNGVLATGVVTGGYYNLLGGMWSQYWAQSNGSSQYRDIDSYTLTDQDFQTQWETLYAVALSDLRKVRENTEGIQNWNMYLQATVMEVYTWQMLVDLYDKVPYFNALKGLGGVYTPGYDDGELIYDDLIVQLDKALSKDFNTPSSTLTDFQKKQDIIFSGDLARWIEFANTLKLKIYLRQMYARPSVAQTGITNLINSGAPFLSEHAMIDLFINESDKDNPLYASNIRHLNTTNNLASSETLGSYLSSTGDTRIGYFFTSGPFMPQGGYEIPSEDLDPAKLSLFKLSPVTPVYFFTTAEVNFMRAEVATIYGIGGNAKDFYDAGVLAAFEMYGLNGSSFIASGEVYEYPSIPETGKTLLETQQKQIIIQKWISMAGIQGLEAFLETNRTGYPEEGTFLTYSQAGTTNGLFPHRLLIPQSEKAGNANLPASLKNAKITDKVWWDTK